MCFCEVLIYLKKFQYSKSGVKLNSFLIEAFALFTKLTTGPWSYRMSPMCSRGIMMQSQHIWESAWSTSLRCPTPLDVRYNFHLLPVDSLPNWICWNISPVWFHLRQDSDSLKLGHIRKNCSRYFCSYQP